MKTLIVEDDPTSGLILKELLAQHGPVDLAVDGEEGLRRFISARPLYDLICIDIMMPGMTGLALLEHIRRKEAEAGILLGHGVKVIMTTALSDSYHVTHAFNEQCEAYLVKPIDHEKLTLYLQRFGLVP